MKLLPILFQAFVMAANGITFADTYLYDGDASSALVSNLSFVKGDRTNWYFTGAAYSISQSGSYVKLAENTATTEDSGFWCRTPFNRLTDIYIRAEFQFVNTPTSKADGVALHLVKDVTTNALTQFGVDGNNYQGLGFFLMPTWDSAFMFGDVILNNGFGNFDSQSTLSKACSRNMKFAGGPVVLEIWTNSTDMWYYVTSGGKTMSCFNTNAGYTGTTRKISSFPTSAPYKFGIGALSTEQNHDEIRVLSIGVYDTLNIPTTTTTSTSTITTTTTQDRDYYLCSNAKTWCNGCQCCPDGRRCTNAQNCLANFSCPNDALTTPATTTSISVKPSPVNTEPPAAILTSTTHPVPNTANFDMPTGTNSAITALFPDNMPPERSMAQVTVKSVECGDFLPAQAAPPNYGKPTMVQVGFALERLDGIDDVGEIITGSGVLFLHWNVTTCSKNSTMGGISSTERMSVPKITDIWKPSVQFTTSVNDILMNGDNFGDDLVALHELNDRSENRILNFYWTRSGIFASVCGLDLQRFPFDKQTCNLTFALQRPFNLVQFHEPAVFCSKEDSGVWKVAECRVEIDKQVLRTNANEVSTVSFTFILSRLWDYYIFNVMLSTAGLAFLNLFSFFLAPDTAERPTFTVTILLALTVAQMDATKDVPKSSQSILLPQYLLLLTMFSVSCSLYQMLTCWFVYMNEDKFMEPGGNCCHKTKATLIGALDLFAFIVAVACFIAIHAYVGYVIHML